jgi:conjugal transfer pilus assembly protein TraU
MANWIKSLAALMVLTAALSTQGHANSAVCPNAGVLSAKLLTEFCWDCMFPIVVMGNRTTGGIIPEGAHTGAFCSCDDQLGVPRPGLTMSLYEPARLVELVRWPNCHMALNGARIPLGRSRMLGKAGMVDDTEWTRGFYHYHYYSFPLLTMLEIFTSGACMGDGIMDFDLLYASELDPTWNHEELAFFTNPESAIVANPLAVAACANDAVSSSAKNPINNMWWCAGTWGHLYPLTGNARLSSSMPLGTSLLATRAITALHRRGLEWSTMGSSAMCGGNLHPMLPKTQYKMAMFFPLPEASGGHVIGESTFLWGEHRQIPGTGEDALYTIFRWRDCCMTF